MSGISCIYILDHKNRVLITRSYRTDVPANIHDVFNQKLLEYDEATLKPMVMDEQTATCFFFKKINNLCFLIVTKRNSNALLVFSFLFAMIKLFQQYFKELEEESIRDNFVVIYELLDEMMDNGYPQTTDVKVLSQLITTEKHELQRTEQQDQNLSKMITGEVPHRKPGIYYQKNEIFLDVIEKVNMLIGAKGNVIKSEVIGQLQMKAYLSGMPILKLGLNDKAMYEMQGRTNNKRKMINLNDMKFHPCVKLGKFENERNIEFVPPDGEFELISYRLDVTVKPLIMVEVIIECRQSTKIDFFIRAKSNFKEKCIANNVEIIIPIPCDATKPQLKSTIGTPTHFTENDAIKWLIPKFPGHREFTLNAIFSLPTVASPERDQFAKIPIECIFEIPYFTVSGIQVRYLKVQDKSGYSAYPWVRYISKNGTYHIRSGLA